MTKKTLKLPMIKLTGNAKMPKYAHSDDAGMDLCSTELLQIAPGEWEVVPTGIALEIPSGWVGLIHPRSGLAAKKGLTVLNTPGTIDAGYRGEIKVILINLGKKVQTVESGDRIAQLVLQEVGHASIEIKEASLLSKTVRGDNGFGSTGER